MKLLKIAIIAFLVAVVASPTQAWIGPVVCGGGVAVSGWTSGCPNAALLACESFDGSSECASTYPSTCDGGWIVDVGVPDFNGTALDGGTYGVALNGKTNGGGVRVYKAFTPTDGQAQEIYIQFRITDIGETSSYTYAFAYFTVSSPAAATVNIKRVSGVNYISVQAAGGTESSASVGTLDTNTTYHLWFRYLKGSGTNAIATAAFSANGVRPTSGDNYVESTNGTGTSNANRLYLQGKYASASSSIDILADKLRIDDATIGDNPE